MNNNKISRREFLESSAAAAFSFSALSSFLSSCTGSKPEDWSQLIDDDFHYFDNNLTNLHFYFLQAKIVKSRLILQDDSEAFMIVKIPQQHISEQLLGEDVFDPPTGPKFYIDGNKNTQSKISGFSYLAFSLFPDVLDLKKRYIDLDNIEVLLDWNNRKYFDLIIPGKKKYKNFKGTFTQDFVDFKNNHTSQVEEKPAIIDFYKGACETLFNKSDEFYPITLLEVPQGLFVTPYAGKPVPPETKDGTTITREVKAVFTNGPIAKQRFIFDSAKGKVTRSVEEIWTTQMWFQQFVRKETTEKGKAVSVVIPSGDKFNPSLRAAGYRNPVSNPEERGCLVNGQIIECECPDNGITFLPTFIDKQELTYITSLGREADNEGAEWNIETRGLVFTGLGAVAKLHYKNFRPPAGTDLAEYEHHITMGRDEYIKVARIGVLSVTGQRALHVKIGQRKIKKGVSYVEYKEYIEIIQPEINYFDSRLFIETNEVPEPDNYIHARVNPNTETIIHSIDELEPTNDDVWREKKIIAERPGWHTHYRRWLFKNVSSVTLVSPPINSTLEEARVIKKEQATQWQGEGSCPLAFWLVLERPHNGKYEDCFLDFKGSDWNNEPVRFSSTCMFIRKTAIENTSAEQIANAIYDNFNLPVNFQRRHVQFIKSEIALAPDFAPAVRITDPTTAASTVAEELPNKSNRAKTDFVEYYFTLCDEPTGNTADGVIAPIAIFNERFFPLFPQVKRAQLYVENLQSYTPSPLPSIIEYNPDFITYGYQRSKSAGSAAFNKARLIFDHTQKFIQGQEISLERDDLGRFVPKPLTDGYAKIKKVFSGAGDAIGGLVNPDFDIQSIGLIKQSIAVGRDINAKLEAAGAVGNAIEKFNPSDLFRQVPEIFNGISLLDILQEVFPATQGPINEIKNIAGQIQELRDDIINNPVYVNLRQGLEDAKKLIADYIAAIENLQKEIDRVKAEIKALKDKLDVDQYFAEIRRLAENRIAQFKIPFFKFEKGIVKLAEGAINDAVTAVTDFIATELMSKAETFAGFHKTLLEAKAKLEEIKNYKLDGKTLSAAAQTQIDLFITQFLKGRRLMLIDLDQLDETKILLERTAITNAVKALLQPYVERYHSLTTMTPTGKANLVLQAEAREALVREPNNTTLRDNLQRATTVVEQDKHALEQQVKRIRTDVTDLAANLRAITDPVDRQIIAVFENELNTVQDVTKKAFDLLNSVLDISFLLDTYKKAAEDFEIIRSKLKIGEAALETILDNLENGTSLIHAEISKARQKVQDYFINSPQYDQARADIRKISREAARLNTAYSYITGPFIWDGLSVVQDDPQVKEAMEAIKTTLGITDDITQGLLTIRDINIPSLRDIRQQIEDLVKNQLKEFERTLRDTVSAYEDALKKRISEEADGIVQKVRREIERLESELLADPENAQLINNVIQARNLYNIITSLSRKDINYNWQTTAFKDADFGIVSFISSVDPKTSLTVDVKNTIHFQLGQFPPVISKIESRAENRLTNFGIGLLKAIIVNFNEASFVVGTDQPPKFDVRIRDVQFAGAFAFVQALEKCFKDLLGDNFSIKIQPMSVEISYMISIPFIGAPSFGFRDILFRISLMLPFDGRPMELGAGIGTLENKTKLSVGIYTGLFYFFVQGNPKDGITRIEVNIEFGGYFGLSLGPLRGEVKLVVGLFYSKDPTGVLIEGYFLCEGRVKLWFITISARFYMGVISRGNYVEGRCTVTYEISLGAFFKKSFSATYYKKFAGATPGNSGSGGIGSRSALAMLQGGPGLSPSPTPLLPIQNDNRNPITRNTTALTLNEWDDFIKTYVD